MAHHCHALNCYNECPPKWLMCPSCWDKVPRTIQAEVYNTVKLRRPTIDGSWAPWWRAQARAIAEVGFPFNPTAKQKYLDKEMAFAETLERKQKAKDEKTLS